jgi:hypothetical protein
MASDHAPLARKCSPAAADRFCNAVENRPPRFAHSLTARAADFQQTVMCVWEKIDPQSEIAAADIYCVKGPALSVLKMEKPICGIKVASEDYYINVDLMKDYPIHFGGESKPAAASIRINGQKEFLFI